MDPASMPRSGWPATRGGSCWRRRPRERRCDARSAAGAAGLIVAGHEAGGRCGVGSSFVLLQAALAEGELPVWVRGGIGERVAAGAVAAGAAGVVLDGALLLARESPIGEDVARADRRDGTAARRRS